VNPESFALVRQKLGEWRRGGTVSPYLLRQLIEKSAWWYDHPQSPTRAPRHADRLAKGLDGLEIQFGANYFLVESALNRCERSIIDALQRAEASNELIDGKALRRKLIIDICVSVADYSHEEFWGGYPIDDNGFMHFGTQAISISDFVSEIWKLASLRSVCGP